ncbi:hypothetical protein QMK33_15800 [Hymenobacter sp. H14-R3]|uniref:hypothetical protein n=1 Tax=Hymenobacter sp. H14-R3 TaxID=3046308 RepID=UPI0024BB6526|nr:hypothetical protein [Hymenobacter sp. H14-R3]MDJ0366621.1 hypothetical protein [Hymenobacter sp. H14-R3]
MIYKSLFLPLLLSSLAAGAQGVVKETMQVTQNMATVLGNRTDIAFSNRDDTLLGSPMLYAGWRPGELLLAGNQHATAALLKYDLYRQELRVRRPQGDSVLLPMSQVREFRLLEPARRFINFPISPPDVASTCAEVLVEGKNVQLVKYLHKEMTKPSTGNDSYTAHTPGALVEEAQYFLRWPSDGRFSPLRLKRASLERALAAYGPALAALKARKGGLGSEAEMAQAVAELEPLLAAPGN